MKCFDLVYGSTHIEEKGLKGWKHAFLIKILSERHVKSKKCKKQRSTLPCMAKSKCRIEIKGQKKQKEDEAYRTLALEH